MKRILFALTVLFLPASAQAVKVKEAVGVVGTYDSTVVNRSGATVGGVVPAFDNSDALRSSTGAKTNVTSSASSVTILAANTSRKGAAITNDSTQVLYLDVTGGTASTSSYTVQLASGDYYEVPFGFSGAITGIWASANGSARVTEFQ